MLPHTSHYHEYTVELPNNGHIGSRDLVLCREVVLTWRLTSKPHLNPKVESIEGCGLRVVESVISSRHVRNQPKIEQID